MLRTLFALFLIWFIAQPTPAAEPVRTVDALVKEVNAGADGATIMLAEGTFELEKQLELKSGMTLQGAGAGKTILTHTAAWKPSTKTLPDPEMTLKGFDTSAYLIRVQDRAKGVTIANLTIKAPQLHGAIFGFDNSKLTIHHIAIEETLWSGIRTFAMKHAKIHDCEFRDAGGRWERGEPGEKGGITGGAVFAIWMEDSEILHCRFTRTRTSRAQEFYGIKVRQAKRCHVHHNTIRTNFSMEFPFENDEDNELDHNVCDGTVSIPKHAGGVVPKSGVTFHIHHNWMRDSYSIEFVRNGVEIDHNLFDFQTTRDHGNLISGFGNAAAKGPAKFHNNLVSNPGRGVIWINEIFNNFEIHNNHIITRTTTTPRKEGLFAFHEKVDFSTITIRDNLIECLEQPRPLVRNPQVQKAKIENNTLINVSDTAKYENIKTGKPIGLEAPLKFTCGVHDEFTIDGWNATPTAVK